jgi:hypothetical protein
MLLPRTDPARLPAAPRHLLCLLAAGLALLCLALGPARAAGAARERSSAHRSAVVVVVGTGPRDRAVLRFRLGTAARGLVRARLLLYPRRSSRRGLVIRRVENTARKPGSRLRLGATRVRSGPLRARRWRAVEVTPLLNGKQVLELNLAARAGTVILAAGASKPRLEFGRVAPPPHKPASPPPSPPPTGVPSSVSGPGGVPTAANPCGTALAPPAWEHVVWIVMENKQPAQLDATNAPYINDLAAKCASATNFFAESHPSLPDYIAMTSGSTQGITDDAAPSSHPLNVPSIFSQLGADWRALAESTPSNCAHTDSGFYAVRHVPSVYYTNIAAECATQTVPLADPPDLSARFTFVTPNVCDDMHSCQGSGDSAALVRRGDRWLAQWMPKFLDSAEYRAGRTAVFLTWDEDDFKGTNQIATLVVSPSTPGGLRVATRYDHYSMLRTTEEMLGLPTTLGAAATAPSMRADFRL